MKISITDTIIRQSFISKGKTIKVLSTNLHNEYKIDPTKCYSEIRHKNKMSIQELMQKIITDSTGTEYYVVNSRLSENLSIKDGSKTLQLNLREAFPQNK